MSKLSIVTDYVIKCQVKLNLLLSLSRHFRLVAWRMVLKLKFPIFKYLLLLLIFIRVTLITKMDSDKIIIYYYSYGSLRSVILDSNGYLVHWQAHSMRPNVYVYFCSPHSQFSTNIHVFYNHVLNLTLLNVSRYDFPYLNNTYGETINQVFNLTQYYILNIL